MNTLPAVILEPGGAPDSAILWLHGLGASGHDFVPVAPHLDLPRTRFVFPHAPERPVTINNGYVMPAWYDITRMDAGPGREPEADVRDAHAMVEACLERLYADGIPSERVVLAGFSQGGAMALHTGHRHDRPLAGIMVLSAYLLLEETLAAEGSAANANTPMLFCHGRMDDVVAVARGKAAYQRFATEGREVEWADYPMGHQVVMEEIERIGRWLRARLP
ncbi:MAG: alpha/beta hydrolase [Deltaproteobacteria bacterium]|nr:MAG: alpha/beta hydrolase [Deltaproteobacteria bacterium]